MMESMAESSLASLSTAELRARLLSLESKRDVVKQEKALKQQRVEWIQRRQQQHERLAQLIQAQRHQTASNGVSTAPQTAATHVPERTEKSKRDEVNGLREQMLQVVKIQQQFASKITDQMRVLRQNDRAVTTTNARDGNPVQAPTPSPPKSPPASHPISRVASPVHRSTHNKLVLVPTPTSVLGKRHAQDAATASLQSPVIQYPPLMATSDSAWGTPQELVALLFRIATRHFLQTGHKCSIAALHGTVATCTQRPVSVGEIRELVRNHSLVLDRVVESVDADDTATADSTSSGLPLQPVRSLSSSVLTKRQVQSLMEVEKLLLDETMASWTSSSTSDPRPMQLIAAMNAMQILPRRTTRREQHMNASTSLEMLLAAYFGVDLGSYKRTLDTAFPHLSPLLEDMKSHLSRSSSSGSESVSRPPSLLAAAASTPTFSRPFDLDHDSVMKQVRESKRRRQNHSRADPMKVMCMFELGGVCNDVNCPYQHQRDFNQAVEDPSESQTNQQVPVKETSLLSKAEQIALNQFVQLRDEMSKWWPSPNQIFEETPAPVPPPQTDPPVQALTITAPEKTQRGGDLLAANHDILELGSPLPLQSDRDELLTSRYCQESDATEGKELGGTASSLALQQYLVTNPEDVDSWLLLALRKLELEVSCSDDQARLSASTRLLGELEALHAILHSPTSDSRAAALSETKIEACLHELSRALEQDEANAQCEELWLLHLRLSQLLTGQRDVEGELQMTEQALTYAPDSVLLWRHFLMLQSPCLDSVEDAAAAYAQQLQCIAAAAQQAKPRHVKDAFSVLLCDVVIQLCALHCVSGSLAKASSFLWLLVGGGTEQDQEQDEDENSRWQTDVRKQMIGDDLLTLYGLHVHITLFGCVPLWLRQRAFSESQAVNAYRLLLPLCIDDDAVVTESDWSEGKRICEAAFRVFGDPELVPPGIEALRHNWVVIVAHDKRVSSSEQLATLVKFVDDARQQRKVLLPRVVTALATVIRDKLEKPEVADLLIEELMERYKTTTDADAQVYQRFGEALHHYLLHRPGLFTASDGLSRSDFPTIPLLIDRLAALLPVKSPVYSKRTIKRLIQEADSKVAQQDTLRTAFQALLRDTLDHIVKCQLGEGDQDDSDEQDITQDTYYVLAQVQLLSRVCGPQEAVDTLERCVIQGGSSKWSVLPRECRRMIWSTRFLLQCELLKLNHAGTNHHHNSSRELFQLLTRYLVDVGPHADTSRTIKSRLQDCVTTVELEGSGSSSMAQGMRRAIVACLERPAGASRATSALDLELFRLCLSAVPAHERPSQFVAFQQHLGAYPGFLLEFLDASIQDSDRRGGKNALRHMALQDSAAMDGVALRSLVLAELKDKNVHGLVQLLRHRVKVDPLDCTAWESLGLLEILFGRREAARADAFATALAKTKGVQVRPQDGHCGPEIASTTATEITLRGSLVTQLSPVFLISVSATLRELDLSSNLLVTLPRAISRLTQLQKLKLSGNALVLLPPAIGELSQLQEIELAHNNLTTIPNAFWDGLLQLQQVDLRCNALTGLSPRVLRLLQLKSLCVAGNNFSWKDLSPLATKLPVAVVVDMDPSRSGELQPLVVVCGDPKDVVMDGDDQDVTIADSTKALTEAVVPAGSLSSESPSTAAQEKNNTTTVDLTSPESVTDAREDVVDVETMEEDLTGSRASSASVRAECKGSESDDDDEVQFLGSSSCVEVDSASTAIRVGGKPTPASAPAVTSPQPLPPPPPPPLPPTIGSRILSSEDTASDSQSLATSTGSCQQPPAPPVDRSSAEWRTSVARLIRPPGLLRNCTLCSAVDTTGIHQRLNGVTLCPPCLQDVVSVVCDQFKTATKLKRYDHRVGNRANRAAATPPTAQPARCRAAASMDSDSSMSGSDDISHGRHHHHNGGHGWSSGNDYEYQYPAEYADFYVDSDYESDNSSEMSSVVDDDFYDASERIYRRQLFSRGAFSSPAPVTPPVTTSAAAAAAAAPLAPPPATLCRFFVLGKCRYGSRCTFSHTLPARAATCSGASNQDDDDDEAERARVAATMVDCPFFQRGNCKYGDYCRLRHTTTAAHATGADNQQQQQQQQPQQQQEYTWQLYTGSGTGTTTTTTPATAPTTTNQTTASATTQEFTCGICFEDIVEQGKYFGLLSCDHCFCLECLRAWRQSSDMEVEVTRACPACRVASNYIVPSLHFCTGDAKHHVVDAYKRHLAIRECKYFDGALGSCPFGAKCFYAHRNASGQDVKSMDRVPRHRRRRRRRHSRQQSDSDESSDSSSTFPRGGRRGRAGRGGGGGGGGGGGPFASLLNRYSEFFRFLEALENGDDFRHGWE